MEYNFKEIEKKWQDYWEKNNSYRTKEGSSPKFYVLDMFPYPSGEGIHVGHLKGYVATDIVSRMKRAQGFDVLHPMGWDAFGLPAENYAIKTGIHPEITTAKNVSNIKRQMKVSGLSYDWERELNTTDPEYYRWTQWIFLKLFEKGLAYKKLLPINWCPSCKTGLANEEVVDGKCERCGTETTKKDIEQWVLRITEYADKLLAGLPGLSWPDKIKEMQKNWIGRSEGWEIKFLIGGKEVPVFTTRADTLFGCTYLVLAPEHPLVSELDAENKEKVSEYVEKSKNRSERERISEVKDKTGVELKGIKAINPVNGKEISVFVADYVLVHYGTGAVMAVPAHDDRDLAFANEHNIETISVIRPNSGEFRIDKKTEERLSALREIEKAFKNIGIKFWFIGNFALSINHLNDFADVDCRVLEKDFEMAQKELENRGYVKEYDKVNDKFKVSVNKKEGTILEVGTTEKDLGGERVSFYGVEIVLTDKERISEYYRISTDKQGRSLLVISPNKILQAFTEDGTLINSGEFDGLKSEEAREKIGEFLKKEGKAEKKVNYKLRDWVFSRQRYWGEPIPIVHCEKCGMVPVPENELPVMLPHVEKYQPTGTGESPLAAISEWVNTRCPECGGPAKRETNTMPQWAGSCWYYLRYLDNKNGKEIFDKKKEKKWMPVDLYVGGAEHAVLHLLYSRFWHKFLYDLKIVSTEEPFQTLRNVGLIMAPDGQKMSKSKGNVIAPDEIINEYGADALRCYEMFMGPFDDAIGWNPQGVKGVNRFLLRFWEVFSECKNGKSSKEVVIETNKLIKKVSEDLSKMKFNTSIAFFMEFMNFISERKEELGIEEAKKILVILSPFAPHLCEELWEMMGNKGSITSEKWPEFDPSLIREEKVSLVIQVNGKVREKIEMAAGTPREEAEKMALENERVRKWISGKEVVEVFFVQDKLINIVIK